MSTLTRAERDDQLLTVADIAGHIGAHEQTVRGWIRGGELNASKFGAASAGASAAPPTTTAAAASSSAPSPASSSPSAPTSRIPPLKNGPMAPLQGFETLPSARWRRAMSAQPEMSQDAAFQAAS